MTDLSTDQGQGGYFFNGESAAENTVVTARDEQDLLEESMTLTFFEGNKFHTLNTIWAIVIEMFFFIGYEVMIFIFPHNVLDITWLGGDSKPFPVLCIFHVLLWLVVFLIDRYLYHQHHKSQAYGYLEFYRQMKNLRRIPFGIVCLANSVLVVILAVCATKYKSTWTEIKLFNVLQIIFSIEFLIVFPCLILYIVKVAKFNKSKALPDATNIDYVNGFSNRAYNTSAEVGFRDSDYFDEILEKQADMIRYLQQHNQNLGQRLVKLLSQNNSGAHPT